MDEFLVEKLENIQANVFEYSAQALLFILWYLRCVVLTFDVKVLISTLRDYEF